MINFNTSPYNDDFDPGKNFHRILFKPGVGVQARELTQSQTILQNQISNFASSIFSQNTPVSGGHVTTNLNCYYIKLNSIAPNGTSITAANFLNQIIQDVTGTILAKVVATVETTTSGTTVGDPPTLIVTYLSGTHFIDNAVLTTTSGSIYSATVITSTTNNPSTGLSSVASISTGVFYIVNGYSVSEVTGETYSIGNFVQVNPQTIVLDKYDNTPSYRVGLLINEQVYSSINDSSLLDPALGSSNYQAPGADRYVITLSLISMPITLGSDSNFIELVRIVNGSIVKQVDNTVYSTIDDYFAKRDYETNGDYIVNDFKLTPSANALGISSEYDISIGKGVAYVHGYRVQNQSQITLTNQRAQSTANINNNAVYVDYGNYFITDTANGVFDIGTVPSVDFHCVSAANVVSTNTSTYTSTLVASGYMRNFAYVSGTGSNTKSYIFNSYVSGLAYNSLSGNVSSSGANTTTFAINDVSNAFSSANSAYYGVTVYVTTSGITDSRNIISYLGTTKTITVDNPFTLTPTGNSVFTMQFKTGDIEAIVKTGANTYNLTANVNINAASKVNQLGTGQTILNNPGTPELIFQVGYPYVAQVLNTSYYSQRVYRSKTFSGNTLTVQATSGNSSSPLRFEGSSVLSGQAAEQLFIVIDNSTGSVLDFTSTGNTVTISSDKTSATFNSATYSNKNVTIIAQVQVSSGDSSSYVLKSKNLVTGNTTYSSGSFVQVGSTGTYQNLAQGQVIIPLSSITTTTNLSLYVNDLKNVTAIYDLGSPLTSVTGALTSFTNITNYYTLNNGQRDTLYDFGSVARISGAPLPIGNILVVFNYYSHTQSSSGDGYFSIQSYSSAGSTYGGVSTSPEAYPQIPTYTATDGIIYKLSDCIDFRPCRVNGQTARIFEYSQTQTSTNDIGVLLPQNLSNFTSNYYYYLGRYDKLVLTKDQSFQIVQGNPSTSPILPDEPKGSLVLANLLHDPYTAYVPGQGSAGITPNLSVNKIIHKRWVKSDITELETRVNNLAYYTALSQLEASTASMQIPDANGVTRPNYGILVDSFSDYSVADTNNPDYIANLNVRTNQLTALSLVNNFQLQNPIVLTSLGTLANTGTYSINRISGTQTNIYTLPYTSANIAVQPLASSTISVNPFSVSIQQGIAKLNPPMDNWVDGIAAPALLINTPGMQVFQTSGGVNLTNSGDFQTIPGTVSTSTTYNSNQNQNTNSATIGYTSSTTQTYASQTQNTSNPTSSTLFVNNGYLTSLALLPYIRPQQISVQASGLLVNTPVSTWFDGVNVNNYITTPNTIELNNVSGTFNQDDIIGFYTSNTFYPIARVINTYIYPNSTNVRLYVADIITAINNVNSTTIQNGTFDINGNYVSGSSTASGSVSTGVISINMSGEITGVGGGYANTLNSNVNTGLYLTPVTQGYCTFLNNYGVWGDANNSTSYSAAFPVTTVAGTTYTLTTSSSGASTVYVNGVSVATSASPSTIVTATFTASGTNTIISWTATSSGTTESAFALYIVNPTNNILFASTNPPQLTYSNLSQETAMYGGGSWFTGVTSLYLGPNASNTNNYYTGATINIMSKYTYGLKVASTYVAPISVISGGAGGGGPYFGDDGNQNWQGFGDQGTAGDGTNAPSDGGTAGDGGTGDY